MAVKWCAAVVLLGLAVGSASANYEFLARFNNAFANYSSETEVLLENLRQSNGELIREFNRELLLEFGRLVPAMRDSDAAFLEEITNFEGVDDECRNEVFYLRQLYLMFQNWDIQDCAYYAWFGLDRDSKMRFWPYHNAFARENSRAIYQVVQTVGRRNIFDMEGLEAELDEELDYYRNLRDGQTDVLREEIAAHADAADKVYRELDECREWVLVMQGNDHTYIRQYLENNCFPDGIPTTTTDAITTTVVTDWDTSSTPPPTDTTLPDTTVPETTMTIDD